jgi:hypothetical protein
MKKAAIVLAALLVAAVASSALAAPAVKKVYYEKPYGQIVYKPKRIDFSDLVIKKIKWRHWNRKVARGHGRARIFMTGSSVTGTARLKMFKRHREGGRRMYGCLTGTTTASNGQTEQIEWPPGCREN